MDVRQPDSSASPSRCLLDWIEAVRMLTSTMEVQDWSRHLSSNRVNCSPTGENRKRKLEIDRSSFSLFSSSSTRCATD